MHVSIVNDRLLETDEVFTASLSLEDETDRGHVQLNPSSTSITIIDDDGNHDIVVISVIPCMITAIIPSGAVIGFVPPAYSVLEGVDRFANLNVQLVSGQLGRDVIVNFDTRSGSAIGISFITLLVHDGDTVSQSF